MHETFFTFRLEPRVVDAAAAAAGFFPRSLSHLQSIGSRCVLTLDLSFWHIWSVSRSLVRSHCFTSTLCVFFLAVVSFQSVRLLASENRILFLKSHHYHTHITDTQQIHTASKKFFSGSALFFSYSMCVRRTVCCELRRSCRIWIDTHSYRHTWLWSLRCRRHTLSAVVLVRAFASDAQWIGALGRIVLAIR